MKQTTADFWFFALLIALLNLPLCAGGVSEPLLFEPARFAGGEWWRALTGPLVHVSAYHLLLDASAFLLLYKGLREPSALRRVLTVAACAAGALLFALPALGARGSLCGLSGPAHGLLAVAALEALGARDRALARAGAACLFAVVGKSALELATGRMLFESLHLGDVARPVAACHFGGVLGGLAAAAGFARRDRRSGNVTAAPALLYNACNPTR